MKQKLRTAGPANGCFAPEKASHSRNVLHPPNRSMTPWPRRIGYAIMAAALALLVLLRRDALPSIGPFPTAVVALLTGAIGVMLVFTDLMVRWLYAQVDAAKAQDQPDGQDRQGEGSDRR